MNLLSKIGNTRLVKDFGITALFGTIILVGGFVSIFMGLASGKLTWDILLPVLSSWVGAVLSVFSVLKGVKSGGSNGNGKG